MPEEYGLKVWLEFKIKNLKEIQRDVQEKLKNVDVEGAVSKARTATNAARDANAAGAKGGMFAEVSSSFGKMGKTMLGVLATLFIIKTAVGKIVSTLAQSSPFLQGILNVLNRSFMLFFRPMGDFLATLLKPLAMLLLRLAVKWLDFTRTPFSPETQEAVKKGAKTAVTLAPGGPIGAVAGFLVGLLDKLKGDEGAISQDFTEAVKTKVTPILTASLGAAGVGMGIAVSAALEKLQSEGVLGESTQEIAQETISFKDKLIGWLNKIKGFSEIDIETAKNMISDFFTIKLPNFVDDTIFNRVTGLFKSITKSGVFSAFGPISGPVATGISAFRGALTSPSPNNIKGQSGSLSINNTFNITGGGESISSTNASMESAVRRSSRLAELELRSRGFGG